MRQIGFYYCEIGAMFINDTLSKTFSHTPLGRYLIKQEQDFIQSILDYLHTDVILQLGNGLLVFRLPEKTRLFTQSHIAPADVLALPTQLPWQSQTFDVLIAAHALDGTGDVLLRLAEWWRVLKPNGRLILTGFNPYSWWRLGKWSGLPDVAAGLPLFELKNTLESNGWQIEQGRFLNYFPPINRDWVVHNLRFLELAGQRWLPHGAVVYALVLRKDVFGVRPNAKAVEWGNLDNETVFALARGNSK